MLTRTLLSTINTALQSFPAVVITGPRQSGKTTLVRDILRPSRRFVSLEDPDRRMFARSDPRSFLQHYAPPVIIDEIQYVPELLSYIKTMIDENRLPGQWIFTGSQSFQLMHNLSQSLAGRAAVLSLLPLSLAERLKHGNESLSPDKMLADIVPKTTAITAPLNISKWILKGGYPELCTKEINRQLWCSSYIATYLERDVRQLLNIGDLSQFEVFLRACASRTAQILNLSELARDIGISVPTAKRWLSTLEASYQVFILRPYFKNFTTRLIKSPKLYFTDTALATYLIGIHNEAVLTQGPSFGALMETAVVIDWWKRFLHHGQLTTLYYLRNKNGLEVDLAIENSQKLNLFEIKTTRTPTPKHITPLKLWTRNLKDQTNQRAIISLQDTEVPLGENINALPWCSYLAQ